MKYDELIKQYLLEDKVQGGKSDGMTVEEIAKKHKVSVESIENQIKIGIPIEYEHTKDKDIAKEISMDHLEEFPDYYTRLKKMEAKAKKGLKETMTASSVMGGSGYGSTGIAPQDNIPYAKGDARVPKILGKGVQTRHGMLKKKKKKKS